MATVVFAGAFATQVAGAEVGLTVDVDTGTVAPTSAVVTASVASDDPVVAYDWGLLPTNTRCRQKSCELEVPIASCRRVEAEVTTVLGERAIADAQACAGDEEGRPPSVTISVRRDGLTEVWANDARGSDRIAFVRMWVDDREPVEGDTRAVVPSDGNCHAVDALVVDVAGRVGFDRRTVCTGEDAPRAWVGYDGLCPPVGATQTVCNEIEHPLGSAVKTATTSAFDVNTCATMAAPTELVRRVLVAEDDAGRRVFTGVFFCGSVTDGPRRLFFADMPPPGSGLTGTTFRISPLLYGGTPPFDIQVTMERGLPRVTDADTPRPRIVIDRLPLVSIDETREFAVAMTITDANGLTASATGSINVRGERVIVIPPGRTAQDGGSACTTAPAPMTPWLCLIALGVFSKRRRR